MTTPRSTSRGLAACRLRFAGASYSDIADALGFRNARSAQKAIERELTAQAIRDEADTTALRTQLSMRLAHFLDSLTPKATEPDHPEHLAAVRTGVAVIDRIARLHALDMAPDGQTYNPTAVELETWVATLTQAAMPALEEGEVVDVG